MRNLRARTGPRVVVPLCLAAAAAAVPQGHSQSRQRAGNAASAGSDLRSRDGLLKLVERPRVPLAPRVTPGPVGGSLVFEHFSFATDAQERVPGIAIRRAGVALRSPAVVVLHGTGDTKEGMTPLLQTLAERGFAAFAIDGRFHGERERRPNEYVGAILQTYRTGLGHPFLFDSVWDVMRLVDYLETRPDVDPARIGLMGISKGGMETYLAAAVDRRIAVAVPVIGVQSFRWGLDHDAWQSRVGTFQGAIDAAARDAGAGRVDTAFVRKFYDRVAPGIYAEFDGPSMLPLIAPRPLLVISGDSDSRTPLPGVHESATAAEQAYRDARAIEQFSLLIQRRTGHAFGSQAQEAALGWFARWLKP